jgi:hypothetical protein
MVHNGCGPPPLNGLRGVKICVALKIGVILMVDYVRALNISVKIVGDLAPYVDDYDLGDPAAYALFKIWFDFVLGCAVASYDPQISDDDAWVNAAHAYYNDHYDDHYAKCVGVSS